jgi:hypothetical protein
MQTFEGLGPEEARAFAEPWLRAWTGNEPDRLLAFYTPDAHYSDPAVPQGLDGHAAMRAYFVKLLRRHPSWVWRQTRSTPMANGFVNFWKAHVPLADGRAVDIEGVCLVHIRDGLIARNDVYFDPRPLEG